MLVLLCGEGQQRLRVRRKTCGVDAPGVFTVQHEALMIDNELVLHVGTVPTRDASSRFTPAAGYEPFAVVFVGDLGSFRLLNRLLTLFCV